MSKKKKQGSSYSRSLVILVLLLIGTNIATLYYFMVIGQQEILLEIEDITGENSEQYIGQIVTISGYVVLAGDFIFLVTHPQYFWTDQLNPSNHLLISGVSSSSLSSEAGMWVSVTGTLQYEDDAQTYLQIGYQAHKKLQPDAVPLAGCNESIVSTDLLPDDIVYEDINPTKYAVLFSGGGREAKAYPRYWNHITWFYVLLLMNGYDPENIFILYKNGTGDTSNINIDYPATSDGLDAVFTHLSAEMGRADSLFLYVTDHGSDDEIITTWNELDPDGVNSTEMTAWVDSVSCNHMIIIMQQCFSGSFLPFLSAPNRIIMTACSAGEYAWASDGLGFSEFTLHLLTAFYGFIPWGYTVNVWADINGDGMISMAEAFGYAATMDDKDETPLYDDNGDQIGSTVTNIIGTDGIYGNNIFL